MLAMVVTLGTWIFAFIALTTMPRLGVDERSIALSFGFGGLLTFFFCLCWSCKRTFKSWYRFLVKPLAQLGLLNVVIWAACFMTNARLGDDEQAQENEQLAWSGGPIPPHAEDAKGDKRPEPHGGPLGQREEPGEMFTDMRQVA